MNTRSYFTYKISQLKLQECSLGEARKNLNFRVGGSNPPILILLSWIRELIFKIYNALGNILTDAYGVVSNNLNKLSIQIFQLSLYLSEKLNPIGCFIYDKVLHLLAFGIGTFGGYVLELNDMMGVLLNSIDPKFYYCGVFVVVRWTYLAVMGDSTRLKYSIIIWLLVLFIVYWLCL